MQLRDSVEDAHISLAQACTVRSWVPLVAQTSPPKSQADQSLGDRHSAPSFDGSRVQSRVSVVVLPSQLPLEQVKRVTSRDWEPLSSQNPSKPPQSLQRVVSSPAPQLSPSVSREQLRLSMRSKLRQSASRQNHSVTVRDCVPLSPHSLPKPLQAP